MAGKNKKISGGGFHHVSLKVSDLNRSIQFYTEGLGFVEKISWGEGLQRRVLLDTGDGNYFEFGQTPDPIREGGCFRTSHSERITAMPLSRPSVPLAPSLRRSPKT